MASSLKDDWHKKLVFLDESETTSYVQKSKIISKLMLKDIEVDEVNFYSYLFSEGDEVFRRQRWL